MNRTTAILSASIAGAPLLALALWLALRGPSKPHFEIAELDDVLGFALLEESFNELPVEERVELVGMMAKRFQSMDAGDSVLLAAFAAGVTGEARDQLERNFFRLGIDLFDKHAAAYPDIPPDQRAAYLDETLVDFIRTTSLLGGEIDERSDAEILAEARERAIEDKQEFRDRGVSAGQAGGMMNFLSQRIGSRTNPHERARLGLYVRDLTRHLRGEPLETGARR